MKMYKVKKNVEAFAQDGCMYHRKSVATTESHVIYSRIKLYLVKKAKKKVSLFIHVCFLKLRSYYLTLVDLCYVTFPGQR